MTTNTIAEANVPFVGGPHAQRPSKQDIAPTSASQFLCGSRWDGSGRAAHMQGYGAFGPSNRSTRGHGISASGAQLHGRRVRRFSAVRLAGGRLATLSGAADDPTGAAKQG